MDRPVIDHRSADFAELGSACLAGMKQIFQTAQPVIIYPSSGTGAWEAALVNTLSPGDRVLAYKAGQFATQWVKVAASLGLKLDLIEGDWRYGVDAGLVGEHLSEDRGHEIKAVLAVHNETSTGVTSDIAALRHAMDEAKHPALLMVDTISSIGSMAYGHDAVGADVTVGASQKGMMLPPGLGFNAVSAKALAASKQATLPRSYWRWDEMLAHNERGFFPYTPATNLLFGLREAIAMLAEEGLDNVFRRHDRFAEATRRAVRAWDLEVFAQNPAEYSSVLTAVKMPEGFDEAALRAVILKKFNMSLGAGLGKVAGRVFRIGHLGDFNELMLAGTLAGVEMGLALAGVPHTKGGVAAALEYLTEQNRD